MSLEIVGLTDWRWKGKRIFGMAANKSHTHSGQSYSGKGSRPRLDRSNANKGIDYDSTGSYRRRRRHLNGEEDDFDVSGHSREELERNVDEFSVHGKQDVAEMNMMLRYLGLPGPANLGIDNDDYELIKRSPSIGSPVEGYQYIPRQESRSNDFSFRQNSGRSSSYRASPSPGGDSRPPLSPPGPGLFTPRTHGEASPVILHREQTPKGAQVRELENRTPTASGAATRNPYGESDGGDGAKKERPSFAGFADVVKKAVAQRQNRIEEDAASVSNFISSHGGPDLFRQASMPCSLESAPDRSRSETASLAPAGPIERASSEPMSGTFSRQGETSVLDGKNDGGGGLERENVAKLEIRDQGSEGPSTSTKLDSKRPEGRCDSTNSVPVVFKPLKPPPPGSRMLRISPDQFSSRDFLNSLAPDASDIVPLIFSASDDDERKSDTDDEQESSDERETGLPAAADVHPEPSNHVPNGGDETAAEEVKPQGIRTDLTVNVPEKILEEIVRVRIDDNPGPVVVQAPIVPVGPKHPWSKGDILGQGSFGTVYDAVDSDGMWFAVKEVSMVEQDKQAQQAIAQLMQEIELLSQFKHENVVQYLGTEKAHGKLYIFLELVSKGSLATICKRIRLTHSQISAYTRQILKGLKYLHDRNIVHRDIKCANILVDTTGTCKVADFGMAKQMQSMDQMKSCKGSAYWMAPEVIDPKKFSGLPADIWSLGCSILEMATGSPPFGDMEWYRVLWTVGHGNAPPIPDTLSETAKDFVKACLDINPAKRPTATQLLCYPFVRQDGPSTPLSHASGGSFSAGLNTLQTISEELSGDFSRESRTQHTKSLANGYSETSNS